MYALVELHDANYRPLANLTWYKNKLKYAELHGYKTFCRTDNFVPGAGIGYQKIHYIKELLDTNPDVEWFWWTGTDTLITNFATRIEDRILSAYHFIVSVDVNGINADSFLIRNSPKGREYIDRLLELEEECSKHWDAEQRAIAVSLGLPVTAEKRFWDDVEVCDEWRDYVKLMPQRYMNSFNYQLYGATYTDHRDSFGWDGNWQIGDWLIHWPAIPLNYRLDLAAFYSDYIIK